MSFAPRAPRRNPRFAVLTLLLGATACDSGQPDFRFSPPFAGVAPTQIAATLHNITVTLAPPGETQGRLPPDADFAPPAWNNALREAFFKSALFNGDSRRQLDVAVGITSLEAPPPSITANATAQARYRITAPNAVAPLFDSMITTTGSSTYDGSKSQKTMRDEAVSRAVQNNSATFMNRLYTTPIGAEPLPTDGK